MKPPTIIAEIGCNHMGEFGVARDMIGQAILAGVDAVKFQKRCIKELLTEEEYYAPHPNPDNSYGKTYGEHREALEFDIEQHQLLRTYCLHEGMKYGCSVWDCTSTREIANIGPDFIKVPSAMNTNQALLKEVYKYHAGEVHVSLGMTTKEELESLVDYIGTVGRLHDTVLFHCVANYPVPGALMNLPEIVRLKEASIGNLNVKAIGFSAHYTGISLDGPAFVLGAEYIERHFTLDRSQKGTDHAASLEPEGLRRVKRDTVMLAGAMNYSPRQDKTVQAIELEQRDKLKWKAVGE